MIHTRLMNARLAAALRLFDTEQSPPDNRIAAILEAVAQTRDGLITSNEMVARIEQTLSVSFTTTAQAVEAEANARLAGWPGGMFDAPASHCNSRELTEVEIKQMIDRGVEINRDLTKP